MSSYNQAAGTNIKIPMSPQTKYKFKHLHPCLDCGKLVWPTSKRCGVCAYKKTPVFCIDCGKKIGRTSKRCKPCDNKIKWQTGFFSFHRGELSPVWKGRRTDGKGYWLVYKPEHRRANKYGYVREHIIVWEEINGKLLPAGWVIHHLNGMGGDNRPVNLVGLPNRKHALVLSLKTKRIQELEAMLKKQSQLL